MTDEVGIEELLRRATLRLKGQRLTDAEAAEAHAFVAEMAFDREATEEREPSETGELFPAFVGGTR